MRIVLAAVWTAVIGHAGSSASTQRPDSHIIGQSRWATIEWNGNRPVAQRRE
jgi:hypothetical protein